MGSSILKVGGKPFYCSCGANVFHKGKKQGLWICNGCGTEYTDETYDSRKTNADRIRAMSDEELAEFLAEEQFRIANVVFQAVGYGLEKQAIYVRRLDWLQQTTEEDT